MSFTTLPTIESFGNNDITSLAVGMTTLDTVLSAVSIANFPTDGQFRLLVDSELMLVTGYDSLANQWQVTRGIEGTTITTHAPSAQVVCILTRGGLLKMKADIETTGGSTFVYRDSEPNPSGSVYATFDGAYAAAQALGVPSTIIIDDSLALCSIGNAAGFGAAVSTVAGTTATITGLLNMTSSVVGKKLALSGATHAGNNGIFPITAYLSPSSVQITNAAAVTGDNNISWFLITDVHASVTTTTALTMIGNMSGLTPAIIGQPVWFDAASNAGNNGQFTVIAYVSPTAVWINNPSAVANDQFFWGTVGGTSASVSAYDGVTTVTLTGLTGMTPNMVGKQMHISGAATPANNGQFSISAYLSATSVQISTGGGNVAPDANNGSILWHVSTAFGASPGAPNTLVATVTGLTGITPSLVGNALMIQNAQIPTNVHLNGSAASITTFVNNTTVTLTGLTGITPSLVGQFIRISGANTTGNNGRFFITGTSGTSQLTYSNAGAVAPDANNGNISWDIRVALDNNLAAAIVGYLSPTSVLWNNLNVQAPDANNGSLWWYVGTNYDLSEITLASTDIFQNFFVYDGATFNQGLRGVDQQLTFLTEYNFQSYGGTLGISGQKQLPSLLVDNGAGINADGNGLVFDMSLAIPGFLNVTLDHQGVANTFANLGNNFQAGISFSVYGNAIINSELVKGGNGFFSINVQSTTSAPPPTAFSDYYGIPGFGFTVFYSALASSLQPFTGSGTFPTPNASNIYAAGPYNVAIGTMYFDQTTGRPFWWNGTVWMTVGGGVEVLTATPGSTPSTPTATLSLAVESSVLINTTGAIAYFALPNGTNGLVKEIVNGVNSNGGQLAVISMQNSLSNDPIDIPGGGSARLTWNTPHGGWIALSTCTSVNNFWD